MSKAKTVNGIRYQCGVSLAGLPVWDGGVYGGLVIEKPVGQRYKGGRFHYDSFGEAAGADKDTPMPTTSGRRSWLPATRPKRKSTSSWRARHEDNFGLRGTQHGIDGESPRWKPITPFWC